MKIAAAIFLLSAFSWVHGEGSYRKDLEFLRWSREYLSSASHEELQRVYPTWLRNADYVRNHHDERFTVALNKFAHLTIDELPKAKPFAPTPARNLNETSSNPPSEVNWVERGDVTPVHNQGAIGCSSLFIFADALSSLHAIETGQLVQYSVEEINDCCVSSSSPSSCACGRGASIGDLVKCTIRRGGVCPAQDYPQPPRDCQCQNETCDRFSVSGLGGVQQGDEKALASAVSKEPVMAGVDASHTSFQLYHTGIYSASTCSSTTLDHLLLVVGYGNWHGEDFWLCKNSWGESWGMNGYIMMARNRNNMCGIATAASYLI